MHLTNITLSKQSQTQGYILYGFSYKKSKPHGNYGICDDRNEKVVAGAERID